MQPCVDLTASGAVDIDRRDSRDVMELRLCSTSTQAAVITPHTASSTEDAVSASPMRRSVPSSRNSSYQAFGDPVLSSVPSPSYATSFSVLESADDEVLCLSDDAGDVPPRVGARSFSSCSALVPCLVPSAERTSSNSLSVISGAPPPIILDLVEDDGVDIIDVSGENSDSASHRVITTDDDDDLEFLGHRRDPDCIPWTVDIDDAPRETSSFWRSFYDVLIGHTPSPLSMFPRTTGSSVTSSQPSASPITSVPVETTRFPTLRLPNATPLAVSNRDPSFTVVPSGKTIVLHPDDPSVIVEALMAKLTCPICYRSFRRKKAMINYAKTLRLRQADIRNMDIIALENVKRRVDLALDALTRQNDTSQATSSDEGFTPSARVRKTRSPRALKPDTSAAQTGAPTVTTQTTNLLTKAGRTEPDILLSPSSDHRREDGSCHIFEDSGARRKKQRQLGQPDIPFSTSDDLLVSCKDRQFLDPRSLEDDSTNSSLADDHETSELRVGRCGHVYSPVRSNNISTY